MSAPAKPDKGLLPRRDLTGPKPDQSRKAQMDAIQAKLSKKPPSKDPSAYRREVLE